MAISPQKVVQWYRDNKANTYGVSDYDLYERAMDDFPQVRKELEEVGNPFNPTSVKPIVTNKSEEEGFGMTEDEKAQLLKEINKLNDK